MTGRKSRGERFWVAVFVAAAATAWWPLQMKLISGQIAPTEASVAVWAGVPVFALLMAWHDPFRRRRQPA